MAYTTIHLAASLYTSTATPSQPSASSGAWPESRQLRRWHDCAFRARSYANDHVNPCFGRVDFEKGVVPDGKTTRIGLWGSMGGAEAHGQLRGSSKWGAVLLSSIAFAGGSGVCGGGVVSEVDKLAIVVHQRPSHGY